MILNRSRIAEHFDSYRKPKSISSACDSAVVGAYKTLQRTVLLLFIALVVSYDVVGQKSLEDTEISILTCRSGDELYSTFGHTAIRIKNRPEDVDEVYNYGVFSFDTPGFYVKFMRGQLPYYLGGARMSSFLREYQYYKRSVLEQKLRLNDNQKREIIAFLADNAKPENREYAYDFFYDNCATRVVDVYSLVGDDITFTNEIEEKSFRDLLKENLTNLPWSEFGIDIVIGARADDATTRRHQMFLPEYLMDNLSHTQISKSDSSWMLAEEPSFVLNFEKENEARKKRATQWPLWCTMLLLLVTVGVNYKGGRLALIFNKSLLIIAGLLGLFLLFMWFGTNHGATRDNWNVLWFNPLLLLLAFVPKLRQTPFKFLILFLLGVSLLNCFVTFLPQYFHVAFAPIILAIALAVHQTLEKGRPADIAIR